MSEPNLNSPSETNGNSPGESSKRTIQVNRHAAHSVEAADGGTAPTDPTILMAVRDLEMHFPINQGIIFQKQVGAVRAVDGISFDVHKGETLGLVGESGCGKSTTGRTILHLNKSTGGKIYFNGQDITGIKGNELKTVRRNMTMIFQDPYASLNPRLTVQNIISEPMTIHKIGTPKERQERVQELL
jgi:oligopeptide transport system ATP-binding protein